MSEETPGAQKKPPIPTPAKKHSAFNIEKRSDRLYKVDTLHKWFAISSLLLFGFTVAMMMADYAREWKKYQREFNRMAIEKTREDMQEARDAIDKDKQAEIQKQLDAAREELDQHNGEIATIEKTLGGQNSRYYAVNQNYQFTKAIYDSEKYECDEANAHEAPNAVKVCEKMQDTEAKLNAYQMERDQLTIDIARSKDELAAFTSKRDDLQKQMDQLNADISRLQIRETNLNPGRVVTLLRNAPVLDMLNASEKVQQILLSNLYNDHPFKQVPRVDRCTTCHLGIDQKVWEEAEQPYKTHPKLDLFLSTTSPHPIDRFGCTTCHSGLDRATSFQDAGHTPRTEEQKEEWTKKYGWHVDEFLETPMLALDKVESGCYKCHTGAEVPQAPALNAGRDLIRMYGCFGCHKIPGYETVSKVGPDLGTVSGKLTKDWMRKWLANPKEFKAEARMPKFWYNTNNSGVINGTDFDKRNEAEINAITEFIWSKSTPKTLPAGRTNGSAERGKKLVETVGCFGCHAVGALDENSDVSQIRRRHGYNLENQGSKVSASWIYNWVKDPRKVWSKSKMPSLRLSDDEAADIAAYLSSKRNPEWEARKPPVVDEKALDEVVIELLSAGSTRIEAEEKIKGMNLTQKNMYAGERLVNRYGCFGCHDIPGFEKAQPIGTELSEAGSKLISQLDFGFLKIEHDRADWYTQKLKNPRVFDDGRIKRPDELLRMPNFGFSDKQVSSIVMVLTSLVKDRVSREVRDPAPAAVLAGRQLIAEKNCKGCHIIEGAGRDIRTTISEQDRWPPNLNTQGLKTQPMWLKDFLSDPGKVKIRGFLDVRMPTFHFSETELGTVTQYFSALDHAAYPFISTAVESTPEKVKAGEFLFTQFQCANCHPIGSTPRKQESSIAAPNLALVTERLRPEWLLRFLPDPGKISPGISMPQNWENGVKTPFPDVLGGDAKAQMEAVRDYLFLGTGGRRSGAVGASSR
ncbi:MAG TPA: c-type cytochrome [Terriglobia bacterium]|nr:c-type cytochrome [Terriglobia bacterium]